MERFTVAQRKTLAEQIKGLDPKGQIVTLSPNSDFTGGSISYRKDSGVVLGETISRLKDEEYVRAWLVVRLVSKLGYPANRIELEKTYTIGRPSPTRAQIDVRVHARDSALGKQERVFMLVEAKRPDEFDSYTNLMEDQLFATGRDETTRGLRYACWYTVEFHGDQPTGLCPVAS